jgi:hypothetical protein
MIVSGGTFENGAITDEILNYDVDKHIWSYLNVK